MGREGALLYFFSKSDIAITPEKLNFVKILVMFLSATGSDLFVKFSGV